MSVNCSKCGAEMPNDAVFCPACGAPKPAGNPAPAPTVPQTQPAPVSQPVAKKAGTDFSGMIDTFFSLKMMVIGFFIAVLVAWIARVVNQFMMPGTAAADVLSVVNITFMAGIGAILLLGGFLNTRLDKYMRVGLLIAGALILAQNL